MHWKFNVPGNTKKKKKVGLKGLNKLHMKKQGF